MSRPTNRQTVAYATLVLGASVALGACRGTTDDSQPHAGPASTVVATRAFAGCPYGVAVGPSGTGYVTSICGNAIQTIDVPAMSLGTNTTVGSAPAHVAINPAGTTAYTTNQLSSSVSVVNVATNTVQATVPIGSTREAYNLIVSKDGARVYVTTNTGKVLVIDAATRTIVDSMQAGPGANGLAFHPSQPILHVSSIGAGTVTAFNTETRAVERTYSVGGRAQRIAIAPSGAELYIANEDAGMQILDLASGAVTSIPIGGPGIGLVMEPRGEYVYVAVANSGKVALIRTASRSIYKTIVVGTDPRNMAIAPDGTVVIADQAGAVHFLR